MHLINLDEKNRTEIFMCNSVIITLDNTEEKEIEIWLVVNYSTTIKLQLFFVVVDFFSVYSYILPSLIFSILKQL